MKDIPIFFNKYILRNIDLKKNAFEFSYSAIFAFSAGSTSCVIVEISTINEFPDDGTTFKDNLFPARLGEQTVTRIAYIR